MNLIETAVKRPVGVFMAFLGVLALGFVSLTNLVIDLFPKIDLPIAVVATTYQGAAPEEVEKLINEPLEGVLSSIEGIDSIQSQAQADSSLVIMFFQAGTNLDNALLEVREKVDQIKSFLPEDANDPSVLRFDPQQMPVMMLSLTGEKPEKLKAIAEDTVTPQLERIKGVASVSMMGAKTREIQVELDPALLAQYGVSTSQVIQALNAENSSASAGTVAKGEKDLQVRIDGEFKSVEDVKNLMIKLSSGAEIRLGDLAVVHDTFQKENASSFVNGMPALVLQVMKQSDGNTVEVADGVNGELDDIRKLLPQGTELSVVLDSSTFIKSSISSVTNNLILAALISFIIIFVFLRNIRSSIIIGVSIPVSLITTFVMMYFSGQTLNVLSLGGLALGVGLIVDNSIVVLENIFKYRKLGYSLKDSAITGTKEFTGAVIAATMTTLVVFLPVVFIEGLAADLFTPLALSIVFSLTASLIVALTLVPMLSANLAGKEHLEQEEKPSRFDRVFAKIEAFYKKALRYCMSHRKTAVGVVMLLLAGSLALSPLLGASFFPDSDQGQISITVEAPTGSSLKVTEDLVMQIEEKLEPYKDSIATSYVTVGSSGMNVGAGQNTASFTIQMVPQKERDISTSELSDKISEDVRDIPGAEIIVSEASMSLGGGAPIQININGEDQVVLEELSQQVVWLISEVEGVKNPETSASETSPQMQIEVNRQVASQYGLSYQQIVSAVQLGINGQVATRYREGGEEIDIKVVLPEDQRSTISDLEMLLIQTPSGTSIPLSSVADLVQVQGPSMITRDNQQRQVSVTSEVEGEDILAVSQGVEEALRSMNFPDGYTYSLGGQSEDMMESFTELGLALLFSIFLVYAVMAIQFESFVHPFVIMFSMPTAIIGIVFGLLVTGLPISVPVFIGFIMLAGIVVNNAILLVDYINILREKGMERTEAILQAGPSRLKPILMTTLTTVLGMVPLGLALGEGAESQQPMAVVVIFGLTFSMFFTLLFVPVVYTYFDGLANKMKQFFKKKRGTAPQSVEG